MTTDRIKEQPEQERQQLIWPLLRALEEVIKAAKEVDNETWADGFKLFADKLEEARKIVRSG